MPALDSCHEQVVNALVKDGWEIIKSSKYFRIKKRLIFIDIEARKSNNGHSQEILLVEVKCFEDENSKNQDLYEAIGQYLVYQAMLDELGNQSALFLAIPSEIYDTIFDEVIRKLVKDKAIKLLIVNIETESVEQWLE